MSSNTQVPTKQLFTIKKKGTERNKVRPMETNKYAADLLATNKMYICGRLEISDSLHNALETICRNLGHAANLTSDSAKDILAALGSFLCNFAPIPKEYLLKRGEIRFYASELDEHDSKVNRLRQAFMRICLFTLALARMGDTDSTLSWLEGKQNVLLKQLDVNLVNEDTNTAEYFPELARAVRRNVPTYTASYLHAFYSYIPNINLNKDTFMYLQTILENLNIAVLGMVMNLFAADIFDLETDTLACNEYRIINAWANSTRNQTLIGKKIVMSELGFVCSQPGESVG
eukprot:GHVR01159955.1.p1 GENE.GHVR01159955.1~~GHVR01159955.1.p1  ORF type:complete len:288 (-),score=25.78 GHVR01159955.1:539-1402(-)